MKKITGFILFVLLLSGCATQVVTYDRSSEPDEIAVLKYNDVLYDHLVLHSVDDITGNKNYLTAYTGIDAISSGGFVLKMTPGFHTLTLSHVYGKGGYHYFNEPMVITYLFEAGKTYRIESVENRNEAVISVIE